MPGLAQRLHEVARGLAIVFDDQDAHGRQITAFTPLRQLSPGAAAKYKAGRSRGPPAEVRTDWGATVRPVQFVMRQPRSKGTPTKRLPCSPCTRNSTASRP